MQIGAAQISFVNPPVLKLDFTGAANVADFSLIDDTVRKVILGIINSMFTLPNRYLIKLDANADYFKTFHYPLGMIRVTVEKAWGFGEEAKSSTRNLLCFALVLISTIDSIGTTRPSFTSVSLVLAVLGSAHEFRDEGKKMQGLVGLTRGLGFGGASVSMNASASFRTMKLIPEKRYPIIRWWLVLPAISHLVYAFSNS